MMSLVKEIKKYLPRPIEVLLTQLYRKWNSKTVLTKIMIEDLTEFYNIKFDYNELKLSRKETVNLCRIAVRINADLWNILNPKSKKEIKHFYEIIPYYPFELAYWHMARGQRKFRKEVMNLSFGNVLEYGGGIGDLCIGLTKKGLKVTYGDVQGINWEFAKWLFKKKGYNIKMIDLGEDEIPEEYDTIICIDTIEHIPYPEIVLKNMARHLKTNGRLIMTASNCIGKTENNPMHLKIEFNAEKLLNLFGVFKSKEKNWLWIKREIC